MKTLFERSFSRDLRKIRDRKVLNQIAEAIAVIENTASLNELTHLKKLQGYDTYYRIRVGDYRIGLEILGDTVIFVRALHRREIYRHFPKTG